MHDTSTKAQYTVSHRLRRRGGEAGQRPLSRVRRLGEPAGCVPADAVPPEALSLGKVRYSSVLPGPAYAHWRCYDEGSGVVSPTWVMEKGLASAGLLSSGNGARGVGRLRQPADGASPAACATFEVRVLPAWSDVPAEARP
jgi:hypothetical protein